MDKKNGTIVTQIVGEDKARAIFEECVAKLRGFVKPECGKDFSLKLQEVVMKHFIRLKIGTEEISLHDLWSTP